MKKTIIYSFSKSKLNLFDNFFVTYKTEINYFSQKDFFQDFTFIEDNSNYSDELVRFDIIYDGNLTEYTKKIKGISQTFSYIVASFNTVIILARIINDYYGNKILLYDLFQFLNDKKINIHNLNKYKISNENDISKNELISKTPISNGRIGKLSFDIKKKKKPSKTVKLSIKFKDKQRTIHYKYTKKYNWKFCIYPYFIIKKNKLLYSIKAEICSLFSIENLLETIKSIKSFNSLRNEFYNQVNENKKIINIYSKKKHLINNESKSENFDNLFVLNK